LVKVQKSWRRGKAEVCWMNKNREAKGLMRYPDEFIYIVSLADYILIDINWR